MNCGNPDWSELWGSKLEGIASIQTGVHHHKRGGAGGAMAQLSIRLLRVTLSTFFESPKPIAQNREYELATACVAVSSLLHPSVTGMRENLKQQGKKGNVNIASSYN